MAGVDVGGEGGRGKRSVSAEINMVPFIDLLLVTVAFLLITAVWTTNSKIDANAIVPGEQGPHVPPPERSLHVHVRDDSFNLVWHMGSVVESETSVKRGTDTFYPELREAMGKEYAAHGSHRDPSDLTSDRAVLHTPNDLPYGELIHVMDAVASVKRELRDGDRVAQAPAFDQTFAVR